jgi:hypothetical protein
MEESVPMCRRSLVGHLVSRDERGAKIAYPIVFLVAAIAPVAIIALA